MSMPPSHCRALRPTRALSRPGVSTQGDLSFRGSLTVSADTSDRHSGRQEETPPASRGRRSRTMPTILPGVEQPSPRQRITQTRGAEAKKILTQTLWPKSPHSADEMQSGPW